MRIRPGARTAVEGLTLLACAALGFYLLLSGRVHLFVGTIITTLLWVACPVLTVMGLWTLAHAVRHPNTTGHHRARIGLLIVAPVALGLFVPLEPLTLLGAASYRPAVRGTSSPPAHSSSWNNGLPAAPTSISPVAIDPKTGKTVGGYDNGGDNIGSDRNGPMGPPPAQWPALKGNPAELTIYDYVQRADDPRGIATLKGRKLTMIGFVSAAPEDPAHAWVLARLKMWCCVADALPFMTTMVGAPSRPTGGSWIRVTGTYLPSSPQRRHSLQGGTHRPDPGTGEPVYMSELPPQVNAWLVIFIGIWLQAVPFLLLGTIISSTLTAFLKPQALARFLPRQTALAVVVAGLAGIALPACECASVPTTKSLVRAGVPTAAALTFMVASPAINPVVIAATAVAYTVNPRMAVARFIAGLLAAVLIGLGWIWLGRPLRGVDDGSPGSACEEACGLHDHQPRTMSAMAETFRSELTHDFIQSCGFLVIGAAIAATVKVCVPIAWMQALTINVVVEAAVLSLLAVIVALCSEADAFMAVSLTSFSPTAQLAFLAIGPIVDVKLMAMEGGAFGAGFLKRFVPLATCCCFVSAILIGALIFSS